MRVTTSQTGTPKLAPEPRWVNITLSHNGGRILIACAEQIRLLPCGSDAVIRNVAVAVMGAINDGLGIRKDLIPKDVCHFCWNELTFNIVVEIVATANRMDPENADRELREALLRRLRDSNLVTLTGDSSGDLSDAAQTATQGGDKIVDQDVPPRLMSSLPTS